MSHSRSCCMLLAVCGHRRCSATAVTRSSLRDAADVASHAAVCHRTRLSARRRAGWRAGRLGGRRAAAELRHDCSPVDDRHSSPRTAHQRHRRRPRPRAARYGPLRRRHRCSRVYFRFRRPLSPVRAIHRTGSSIVTLPLR